ncbi:MAG: chemotaxis protein CheW [Gammaproteobacteria bacterium]|nr:chemotaxis protein CheW [Gammaproteobacteria bacterium]
MNNVSQMSDSRLPDQIACLLVPMGSSMLLLPNETVAEVVSDLRPDEIPDQPDWSLGEAEWRGLKIPVLAYEKMDGGNEALPNSDSRLVVMNSVKGDKQRPFYALLSQHAPKLVRVFKDEITEESSTDGIKHYHVTVNGEEAIIPNLEWVEEQLRAS